MTGGDPIELVLAKQANAAMKAGADPQQTTALLQQMVAHLRQNPDLAKQATGAIAAGADPLQISNELAQQMGNAPHPKLGNAAGMLSGAAQGATFGFADEALGAIDAANKMLPKALGGQDAPLSDFGKNYRQTRDMIRASDTEYAHDNPLKYGGAALAGGLASSLGAGGAKALASAPSFLGKLGTSLEQGAVAGGLSGFGSAEGSPTEQADQAVRGAMLGAPVGMLATALGAGAGKLGSAALNKLNLRPEAPITVAGKTLPVNTVEQEAAEQVNKALAAGGKTADDAAQSAAQSTKPQTLMEIGGQPVARLARTARAASPQAGAAIDQTLEQRTAGAPDRAIQDALETSGLQKRSSAFQTTKQLIKSRADEAKTAYGAAFQDQTPISDPRIQQILDTPAGQQAWKRAQRMMANDRVAVPSVTLDPPPPAGIKPEDWANMLRLAKERGVPIPGGPQQQAPTLQQLHYLKLALDDLKQPGLDRGEGAGGLGYNEGRSIKGVQSDLLNVMDERSPAYAQARQQYAEKSALKNANELGQKLFSMKPEEAADEYNNLGSNAEKEVFRRAGMDALADRLENGPLDVEKGVSKPRDLRRIRLLFPDDNSFQQFRDRIAQEAQQVDTHQFVSKGSQTADKLMDLADMLDVSPAALKLAKGNPSGAMMDLAKKVAGLREKAYGSKLGNAIQPFVTAGGNGDQNALRDAIEKLRALNAAKAAKPPARLSGGRGLAQVAGLVSEPDARPQ